MSPIDRTRARKRCSETNTEATIRYRSTTISKLFAQIFFIKKKMADWRTF